MKPDIATVVGLIGAVGIVGFAIAGGNGGIGLFIDVPSLLIVGVGSIFVALMKFGIGQFAGAVKIALKAFLYKPQEADALILTAVMLAEKARKSGIVALEEEEVENEELAEAIKQIVDNVDPNVLKLSLMTDMAKTYARHETGRKIFEALGDVGPAMGMIGTLIGLVQMLAAMEDPSAIGPAMAIALLTTLYGAMLGNMFALPIADKLLLRSQEERDLKMLLIDAVGGIQAGMHPRILQTTLMAHLPVSKRPKEED